MKRILVLTFCAIHISTCLAQSMMLDTLYYDKNWEGVENKAFADFYRIIPKEHNNKSPKRYRDYHLTGELYAEGKFITIDQFDDSKSVFDGENSIFYKSGKIRCKSYLTKGVKDGEYTKYTEEGLITEHLNYKLGKLDGICTVFEDNGNICIQRDYENGKPALPYYIVSNNKGLCSKLDIDNNKPIYENPLAKEIKTEYKEGRKWWYYDKDGIMVGAVCREIKDYGKYYKVDLIISNSSLFPIEFNPSKIRAFLFDNKENKRELEVYSAEKYIRKIKKRQNWNMALMGIAEGLAAAGAGYSSSTTNTSSYGNTYSYGSAQTYDNNGYSAYGNYSGSSSYWGTSSSTTTTYDGAAAYQASVIASQRMASFENRLLSEREAKEQGYLKRTTIYPGETISGYFNIKRKKGKDLYTIITIEGAQFPFSWIIE